jgi:hypothetical protein
MTKDMNKNLTKDWGLTKSSEGWCPLTTRNKIHEFYESRGRLQMM